MSKWNTPLIINGEILSQVKIRRGIFQEDSLSPQLFIASVIALSITHRKTGLGYQKSKDGPKISHLLYINDLKLHSKTSTEIESLLNTHRIFSNNIEMEFKLDKCVSLVLFKGKPTLLENVKLPNNAVIKNLSMQ